MFSNFHKDLHYKEFIGLSESNVNLYADEITIKGLRIKGQIKVTHSEDGDAVTCTICYRTDKKLVPKSLIEGHEIMECVPINSLMLHTGYLNYVK